MARKRKNRLRSTGKVEEQDLLENSRRHFEEPDLVQVACVGGGFLHNFLCPVQKLNRALAKVHAKRTDATWLKNRSRRGRGLAKAYAGTLLLADAEEAPYVAQAKLPFGTFPYAVRGTAGPEHFLGLQHWDDPRARLLSWSTLVKKQKFRFFAVDDHVVCAHVDDPAPEAFRRQAEDSLSLAREGALARCPHPEGRPALRLTWAGTDEALRICTRCDGDGNSAHRLLAHAATPSPAKELAVTVELPRVEGAPETDARDDEALERWYRGELTDAGLAEAFASARRRAFRALPPPFFVADDRAWREAAPFIDALAPTDAERRALEAALADPPRAVAPGRASAARALEAVWPERGEAALRAAAGGDEGAALYEADASAERIAELVRKAADAGRHRRAEAGLPHYARLPDAARVGDRAARAFRRGGAEAALREVRDVEPGPGRAVALAVRLALGTADAQLWKHTHEEADLARAIVPHVEALLHADPDRYHDALATMSRAAGTVEEFRPT